MPRSCSPDLRARVIAAVGEGASRREAAERFDVSASSAVKWLQSWRNEGRGTAKPRGGSRSPLEDRAEEVLALVSEQPDRTLDELTAAMRKRRVPGSRSGLWRFLERHDLSFKKKAYAAEQERADVARARRRWIWRQRLLDSSSLVFIDETSVKTNMARLRGRCLRGERLIGRVPLGTWKTLTFVAGRRRDEMTAPLVIPGAMNGQTFLSYVEQCLAPTLNRGDIVVMDNLRTHKVTGVKEALEAVGAELRYLPQYSPDLNPIEMSFSKLKAYLRKAAERTERSLHRRIGTFLSRLSARECANYFAHAGYVSK
ncbi:MAG: IS630 family transposase [Acetobacteraceae bacterium]